jgi:hypothetical protein
VLASALNAQLCGKCLDSHFKQKNMHFPTFQAKALHFKRQFPTRERAYSAL